MPERQAPANPAWQLNVDEWYTDSEGLNSWPLSASTGVGGDDDGWGGGSGGDGEASPVDLLLMELAETGREVTDAELRRIREHIAGAGFASGRRTEPGSAGTGVVWQGRVLTSRDRLAADETHFIKHVLVGKEWPEGTTLADYLESIRKVVLDPVAAIALASFRGRLQVSFLRESGNCRGPRGQDWILVEYRPAIGRIVTAFQPTPDTLGEVERRVLRWLTGKP